MKQPSTMKEYTIDSNQKIWIQISILLIMRVKWGKSEISLYPNIFLVKVIEPYLPCKDNRPEVSDNVSACGSFTH